MSAIGREGGHSRGRTRQPLGVENVSIATDTEGQNYIGQASDRGAFGEPQRTNTPPRQETGNDLRSDNNTSRGPL